MFSSEGRICRANKSHHHGRIEQRKPVRRMKLGRRVEPGRHMRRIWLEQRMVWGETLPIGTSIPRPVLSNLCRKKIITIIKIKIVNKP